MLKDKGTISNAKEAYNNELGEAYVPYDAKIGLMYLSEYFYAASQEYWTYQGEYNATTGYNLAADSNWMENGTNTFTISPVHDKDGFVFAPAGGSIYTIDVYLATTIRPTFNLTDNIVLKSGTGSSANPYRIEI